MQKVAVLQTFIKGAAVSGIGLVWLSFTIKSFKTAWHIISTSPEIVICENCKKNSEACQDEFQEPFYDELEE